MLLYGCESWTLKASLEKSLDGSYTRMLRVVLNIDPREHIANKQLYSGLPRLSDRIEARRMKLAGHCHRHQELPASKLVLWEPKHGHRLPGGHTLTYVDVLRKDAGVNNSQELAGCMEDREDWNLRWKTRLRTTQ